MPIGVSLGHEFGWRSPFLLVAILTILLIISVYLFFGEIKTAPPISLKEQVKVLRNKKILFGQLTTFFFLAAHFTLYGYLTPFVKTTMGFDGTLITIVYFVYGAAAVTGGGIGGYSTDKFGSRPTLLATIVLLAVCLLIMPYVSSIVFWIVLVVWGILSWTITLAIQDHLIRLSPETADIQQSLNNAALHLGIAFGTLVGSIVVDKLSIMKNSHVGVLFAVITLIVASISLKTEYELAND